jgi:8-oxo-dGTP diphosphatase
MEDKRFAVATKAVIYRDGKFLILFKSSIEDVNPNSYDIPGGRLQFGEKLEEGLKREAKEEAGLEVEVVQPTDAWSFLKDEDTILAGITYLTVGKEGEVKLSEEHDSFEWLSYDEVMKDSKRFPDWLVNSIEISKKLLIAYDKWED